MRAAARNLLKGMVGARRFELRTSCSRSRRATRLRYAPKGHVEEGGVNNRLFSVGLHRRAVNAAAG